MKCIVFLLESTMISTTDETENVTQTIGRTKTYGNHVVTAKNVIIFFRGYNIFDSYNSYSTGML